MAKYHHGDLRRQLLELASEIAAEYGTEAVTLRELARKANVSHSAPVHHFKSRKNLLTELATQGFNLLNATLEPHQGNIYDMGVAYVLWAVEHPGFYTVMWQPYSLDAQHHQLTNARDRSWSLMSRAVASNMTDQCEAAHTVQAQSGEQTRQVVRTNAYAAFSLVHGLSNLWLAGVLPQSDDRSKMVREVTRRLVFTSETD